MNPQEGDYIDIHNHGGMSAPGIYIVENLMVHEERMPDDTPGMSFSAGLHPWFLEEGKMSTQLGLVREFALHPSVIAIGEAGYDKLKGPDLKIQQAAFEQQAKIAEEYSKPLFIHCVRRWEELLSSHTRIKPRMPWIVHGFRGTSQLALQLIKRNMYISFWFDFIIRKESASLVKSMPPEKIFLETDGSDVSIKDIYTKVASDLGINEEKLKQIIFQNFNKVFILKD